MTIGEQVVERIEGVGGVLGLNGDRIRCLLPEDAAHLLDELRAHRDEVLVLLRRREEIPPMPSRVHLIQWNLRRPPVAIETCAVVTDPILFANTTLRQLRDALSGPEGANRIVPELIDRLSQVGVIVTIDLATTGPLPGKRDGDEL
jgi:hypothetical protein